MIGNLLYTSLYGDLPPLQGETFHMKTLSPEPQGPLYRLQQDLLVVKRDHLCHAGKLYLLPVLHRQPVTCLCLRP